MFKNLMKEFIDEAKKGNGPIPDVILAVNNLVIANTSSIPEKREAALQAYNQFVANTQASHANLNPNQIQQADTVPPTAVEEQVSSKSIIKPVMFDYIQNHITERKDFPQELISQNMSEIELIKQLVRLRKDELNDLLAKAIIDTKDLDFITQVINLQDLDYAHEFNLTLIKHSKKVADGYELVFKYITTHNTEYNLIAPILDKYDDATTKDNVALLNNVLDVLGDNNLDLIGMIFEDLPTE